MKIRIVYDSKYGNNKQIAEFLGESLKSGNEVKVEYAKSVSPKQVIQDNPDILLFGGPVHAGMVSFTMKRWASKFTRLLNAKGQKLKKAGVWGTHGRNTPDIPQKLAWPSVEVKWKAILSKLPAEKTVPEIIDINVEGMEGPMEAGWQDIVIRLSEEIKAL